MKVSTDGRAAPAGERSSRRTARARMPRAFLAILAVPCLLAGSVALAQDGAAEDGQRDTSPSRSELVLGPVLPQPEQYFQGDEAGGNRLHTPEDDARIPGFPVRQHPVNAGLFDTGCNQCHRLAGPLPPNTNAPPDIFDQLGPTPTNTNTPPGFTQLTTTPTRDEYPTWSPNNQHILYESRNDTGQYQLWLMNADGTNPHQITHHHTAGWATWHPTNHTITYWAHDKNTNTNNLYTYDPQTQTTQQLTHHHTTAWPQWNPQGTHLAYQAKQTPTQPWTLHLHNPETNTTTNLTQPQDTLPSRPIWNPDGDQILYQNLVSTRFELTRLIFPTDQDGDPDYTADPRRLATTRSYPVDLGASGRNPAWNPAGDRIAFAMYTLDEHPDLGLLFNYKSWTTAPDGTNPKLLNPDATWADRSPTWTEDGSWIAQWSWNEDYTAGIWLVNPDTERRIHLTEPLAGDALYPTWSPDGSKIAFASNHAGNFDIWVADVQEVLDSGVDRAQR